MANKLILSVVAGTAFAAGGYFYLTAAQPITPQQINEQLPQITQSMNEAALVYGVPYTWSIDTPPHKGADGVVFTSVLRSPTPEAYPPIPLTHHVTGSPTAPTMTTTLGDFPGKARWQASAGGEEPLTLVTQHGLTGTTGQLTMPASTYQAGPATLSFDGLTGSLDIDGGGTLEFSGTTLTADGPGEAGPQSMHLELAPSTMTFESNGTAQGTMGITSVTMIENGVPTMAMDNAIMQWLQTVDDESYYTFSVTTTVDSLTNTGPAPAHLEALKWTLSGTNFPQTALTEMQQTPPDTDADALMAAANAALQALKRPVTLETAITAGGTNPINLNLFAEVAPLADLQLGDPAVMGEIIQRSRATLSYAGPSHPDSPAMAQFHQQGAMLGLLVPHGETVQLKARFEGGKLTLNGQSTSIPELMQSLAPPEQASTTF